MSIDNEDLDLTDLKLDLEFDNILELSSTTNLHVDKEKEDEEIENPDLIFGESLTDESFIGENVPKNEKWLNDPIRMYLVEIGRTPLLKRSEEISLSREIELHRAKYQKYILRIAPASYFAYRTLTRMQTEETNVDRSIEVSVTDDRTKELILERMKNDLPKVSKLLLANIRLWNIALSKSSEKEKRKEAWRALSKNRNEISKLLIRMSLKGIRYIDIWISKLSDVLLKLENLRKSKIESLKSKKDLIKLMNHYQITVSGLRTELAKINYHYSSYVKAKKKTFRR